MRLFAVLAIAQLCAWSNAAQAADQRGYSAGHYLLSLDGEPAKMKRIDSDSPTPPQVKKPRLPQVKKVQLPTNKPLVLPRTKIQPHCSKPPCALQNGTEKK